MKILKLTGVFFALLLFFGFTVKPKAQDKVLCAAQLYASNQSTGTAKLYRVTYYDNSNTNVSTVVNLSNGQSTYLGLAMPHNEISVLTKGGAFNNVVIEDASGNVLYSQPYVGSGLYWFYNVNIDCLTPSYIKLY